MAAATQPPPIRIGVIGLGRLWEARHKPALARITDKFRVAAVYDQVARRTATEARQLGCVACEGLNALIRRDDVDAIYLLGSQWFGLHPVALAAEAGKPVYCALPLAGELQELEGVADVVARSGIPFMAELARRFYPATLRLRELLATTLGTPRLILGESRLYGYDRYGQPGPATQVNPAPLLIDPGSYLLDWCRFVVGAEPSAVVGQSGRIAPESGDAGTDFESFNARFPGGEIAQIASYRYNRDAWREANRFLPQPGFQVFAERGAAWLEMPDRILWSDATGTHEERLPLEPSVGETLNEHFHRLVLGQHSLAPTFAEVLALARAVARLAPAKAVDAGGG